MPDLLRPVKQWQAREESKDLAKVAIRGLLSKATRFVDGQEVKGPDEAREKEAWIFLEGSSGTRIAPI